MKEKIRIDWISTVTIVAFTYVVSLLIAYLLDDAVSFSGIYNEYLATALHNNASRTYSIVWEICFFCAYMIANLIAYFLPRKRRREFLSETKGLIPIKQGLFWHLRNNWATELLILAILSAITIGCYFIAPRFSPLGIVYRLCGPVFGTFLTPLFIALFQHNHILFSQYRWRISHYMHK